LSVATHIPFSELVGLEEDVLTTYVDVLREMNREGHHG